MEKKGNRQQKYSGEFKVYVIMEMRKNQLSYKATMRRFFPHKADKDFHFLKKWERVYLEEGELGLMTERRGRKSKGRPKKELDKTVEGDLIAENQRLKEKLWRTEMELEYIKKLSALVLAEEQENGKKPESSES